MEQTLPDLQAQIDQLSVALRQFRETQDQLQPMEQRLSLLSERCAEILNRWTDTDQRHARAVSQVEARLNEWSAIETRLEQDSLQRIREFEGTIEHEWQALRQMHAEPVKQLREQTAALGETCAAAANLALRGFERAEARFAALESDLQERLTQLSHDVQTALSEMKGAVGRPAPLQAGVAPFPLEGIMRIHEELRESVGNGADRPPVRDDAAPAAAPPTPPEPSPVRQLPEAAASLAVRMETLEREVTSANQEVRDTATRAERMRRDWRLAFAIGALVIVVGAVVGVMLQSRINARLDAAATRVAAAERQAQVASDAAAQQIASTRAEADRQIAEARDTALRAQIVSHVLAAPDLIRFILTSPDPAGRAYAQVLLSRSRGLVLSASRLPPPPDGSEYQIWWLTDTTPVSAGPVTPDASGRVTLATDTLTNIPPRVTGVIVTLEPAGGSATPSGAIVLTRRAQP